MADLIREPDQMDMSASDPMTGHGGGWTPDRRLPLADQIYADLRWRIVCLDLPPNHGLSRTELSDYYGVSLTPLRDAMQKLEAEGLLAIYPQSRTLVTRIDTAQVRETQFLRTALEVEIVALLASDPDRPSLAACDDACERLARTVERDRPFEEFNLADKDFHRALYTAAGKAGLFDVIEQRSGQLDRIRRFHLKLGGDGKSAQVVAEHGEILRAIEAGNPVEAAAAMRRHLSGTLRKLDELRGRFPESFG